MGSDIARATDDCQQQKLRYWNKTEELTNRAIETEMISAGTNNNYCSDRSRTIADAVYEIVDVVDVCVCFIVVVVVVL